MPDSFPFPTFTNPFHTSIYPAIDPTTPALSAKGKTILVTGGGKGVGRYIATSFASAGARAVIILGRTASSLQAAEVSISSVARVAGHETMIRSFVADILDTEALSTAFKAIRRDLGAIDVFINNAGDLYLSPIEHASADEYWRSFEVNVRGTLNCIQAFQHFGLNEMGSQPPTFINISTIGVHLPAFPGMSAYAGSKLAAWKMVQYLATEMGNKLRVFSIHPGHIATEMSAKAGIPATDDGELPGAFCVWLAGTADADFLCGRMLWANWDVDELLKRKDEIVEKNLLTMSLAGWGA